VVKQWDQQISAATTPMRRLEFRKRIHSVARNSTSCGSIVVEFRGIIVRAYFGLLPLPMIRDLIFGSGAERVGEEEKG
jgi:hypothetical protein